MKVKNEMVYQLTMKYIKQMLENKIISLEEYNKINVMLSKKYEVEISGLFEEISR